MTLSVVVHCITCFFYRLANDENIGLDNSYLGNSLLNTDQAYVKTLYFIITTISTVGYGDVLPKTPSEIAYVMFVQFIGVMIFAFLTGSITSILINLNLREKMLSENEINLDKWFIDLNSQGKSKFPEVLQKNIKDYFMHFWKNDYTSLLSGNGFMNRMPLNLKAEFEEYLYSDDIGDFKTFFTGHEKQLKSEIMSGLYPRLFEESSQILKIRAEVDEIYIIKRGSVVLASAFGLSFLELGPKSFFGEEFALLKKTPKMNFLAGELGVECLCINKSKYIELLMNYPQSLRACTKRAFKRGKYFKAAMIKILKNDELSNSFGKSEQEKTKRSKAIEFIDSFSWEFSTEEKEELKYLIMKNNELTVNEIICGNLRKSTMHTDSIKTNVERVTESLEIIKRMYSKDVKELIYIIHLLREGHAVDANDEIARIKETNQI